ncbi:MAG: hemerythrin domain-containing protein [Gallionellaceae bacterium]|jgi:hemerythrin-like domain-containing protein|nr:hemerythrin domain-containing protein [Gallionellaceae bacterium]
MKRSVTLQPLSREHHTALTLAKACGRAAQPGDAEQVHKVCQRVLQAFADELEPHFQIEEQTFLPLLDSAEKQQLVQRTLAEHQELRVLLDDLRKNDAQALTLFGERLSAHVRFEERELFPALEELLSISC